MNVEYLIQVLENRLSALAQAKDQAFITGDLERINSIDDEINSVRDTLSKLKLLTDITQIATVTNTSASAVVAAGVEATQNPISSSSPVIILGEYDLSSYATDPLYEEKINNVLLGIGDLASATDIDNYIQSAVSGGPITGEMVFLASQNYAISARLLTAMLELESRFGTAGVGATTLNPGNVGNTGTEIRNFNSWQEGVSAVAEWLSRHRIVSDAPAEPISNDSQTTEDTNQEEQQEQTPEQVPETEQTPEQVPETEQTPEQEQQNQQEEQQEQEQQQEPEQQEEPLPIAQYIPVLTTMAILPAAATLLAGSSQQLNVKISDENGQDYSGATIIFSSDNPEVATVDATGLVTAVSAGEANITANVSSGDSISLIKVSPITVNNPLPVLGSVTFTYAPANMPVGSSQQLTVNILDDKGKDFSGATTSFTSDNSEVATVDNSGLVNAVSVGEASITATATYESKTVTTSLTINVSEINT